MLPSPSAEHGLKPRAVEPGQIIALVFGLRRKGVRDDDIPFEIARRCYVDLDELNDVMRPLLVAG